MTFALPDLPYDKEALAPRISAETLELHHGKHHATYVKTLNELVAGTEHENASLEDTCTAGRDGTETQPSARTA